MTHEQMINQLIKESKENCLSLPWIIGYAAHDDGHYQEIGPGMPETGDSIERKTKTLALIRDLLNTRRLQAGVLADGGVDSWRIPVEAVVNRIDREWTALGKEPDMKHDICWLGECSPERWPHGE